MKKTRASESKNVIGERVRLARRAVRPHVSQEDLSGRLAARGIQITQTGISKLENRQRYVMDYEAVLFHFNSVAISMAPSTRPYSGKFILSGKSNRPRNPAAISRFRSTKFWMPYWKSEFEPSERHSHSIYCGLFGRSRCAEPKTYPSNAVKTGSLNF